MASWAPVMAAIQGNNAHLLHGQVAQPDKAHLNYGDPALGSVEIHREFMRAAQA